MQTLCVTLELLFHDFKDIDILGEVEHFGGAGKLVRNLPLRPPLR